MARPRKDDDDPTERRDVMSTAAAGIALIAAIVVLVSLVMLQVVPTGLLPVSDPVSAYALTKFRAAYATAAVAAATAGVATAVMLTGVAGTRKAVVALVIFAAAPLLIPLVPMDRPGTRRTRDGRMHIALAVAGFAAVTIAAFSSAEPLADSGRARLAVWSLIAGIAMAVGALGTVAESAARRLCSIFGIAERLIYVAFIGWFAALSIGALLQL